MRHVYALDVACPTCASHPGLRCFSLVATKPVGPHEARRKRAREEEARLNPHVHGQLPLWGKAAS
jgi:hypothetical protein